MKTKETHMLDLNLHKQLLYKTFALLPAKITRTEQISNLQIPLIDTVEEVHHVIVQQIVTLHHKIDILLNLEIDTVMTELLLPHNLADQDMTNIDQIHALIVIVHHTDFPIDRHIDDIHDLDIDHVHTPETSHFRNTLRHIDLLLDQEILDLLDLDHILKQKQK